MHYDAGLFHRINKNFDTRFSLYHIDIDNYIVANSGDSLHTSSSSYGFNMDQVVFYGFEAEFNSTWFERLTLFGNYTYRKTYYDKDEVLAKAILLEITPEHKANLSARYKLFENTLVTSDIRYMSERETEGDYYSLDAVTIVDAGIEQKLSKMATLRAYAGNLFGVEYEEVYGYPMPEHIYGVNLKMVF